MSSRNDYLHHHDDRGNATVTTDAPTTTTTTTAPAEAVEDIRHVPFTSSGGARPLPYPFGQGRRGRTSRLSPPRREKGEDRGTSQTPNIKDLIKRAVWEALEKATAASGAANAEAAGVAAAEVAATTGTGAEAGGTTVPALPSPPPLSTQQPPTFPFPTEQRLTEELAQGLKQKHGKRRTGGRGYRTLDALLEAIGDEKAVLTLIQMKGGTAFDRPSGKNEQRSKGIPQLEEALGKEATQKLIAFGGGTRLYIPRLASLETDRRNREICLERDRLAKEHPNMSEKKIVARLALQYRLSDNSIWRTLKRYYEFVEPGAGQSTSPATATTTSPGKGDDDGGNTPPAM